MELSQSVGEIPVTRQRPYLHDASQSPEEATTNRRNLQRLSKRVSKSQYITPRTSLPPIHSSRVSKARNKTTTKPHSRDKVKILIYTPRAMRNSQTGIFAQERPHVEEAQKGSSWLDLESSKSPTDALAKRRSADETDKGGQQKALLLES
ncbi:hypothetical protein MMC25_006082 [Agyrium rufum]|nr:hypothetical protein [Agyrium rufum]